MVAQKATDSIPGHLELGIAFDGMLAYVEENIPDDALSIVNQSIPRDKNNKPKYPENNAVNGYVNQFFITRSSKVDKLSVCERLKKDGSPHVAKANVFVSWYLDTPLETVFSALETYLEQTKRPRSSTYFWVCDFVIRQHNYDAVKADLVHLGSSVEEIGNTVLLLEPWSDPHPLRRAYCIKEVYHTQRAGAIFDLIMSREQQETYEKALRENFDSIMTSVSGVNVREAECRNKDEQAAILKELDADVGLFECNKLVISLMRKVLLKQGTDALQEIRGDPDSFAANGYSLVSNLAKLNHSLGYFGEARNLFSEAIVLAKQELGEEHELTLSAIFNYAQLQYATANKTDALSSARDVLEKRRKKIGETHPNTLHSLKLVANILSSLGQKEEAIECFETILQNATEEFFPAYNDYAQILQDQGKLEKAASIQRDYLNLCINKKGERSLDTLSAKNNLAQTIRDQAKLELKSSDQELRFQGTAKLEEALNMSKEVLKMREEVIGKENSQTITSMNNVASLLYDMGDIQSAVELMEEALELLKTHSGPFHQNTISSTLNLAIFYHRQGNLEAAGLQYRNHLEGCNAMYGISSDQSFSAAHRLYTLLLSMGKIEESNAIGIKQHDHGGWTFNPPT